MTPRSLPNPFLRGFFVALALTFVFVLPQTEARGQSYDPDSILAAEGYITPPDTILSAALAPRWRNFSFSNPNMDGSWYLETISDGLPGIDVFSKPYHELGGEFIDFGANRNRNLTTRTSAGLRLRSIDGETMDIQVPEGTRISNPSWSPDGQKLAFFAHSPTATHIYVAEVSNGNSRSITRNRPVLATTVSNFSWTEDSQYIVTVLIPEGRPPMPVPGPAWTGPEIKVSEDGKNMVRTYPSLMGTPHEKDLLEWLSVDHGVNQVAARRPRPAKRDQRRKQADGPRTTDRCLTPSMMPC